MSGDIKTSRRPGRVRTASGNHRERRVVKKGAGGNTAAASRTDALQVKAGIYGACTKDGSYESLTKGRGGKTQGVVVFSFVKGTDEISSKIMP